MAIDHPAEPSTPETIALIVAGRHGDPFSVLGPHRTEGGWLVRAFLPDASAVAAVSPDGRSLARLAQRHAVGFFEGLVPERSYRLEVVYATTTAVIDDPYAFPPVLGALDDHLFVEGRHHNLYKRFGARVVEHEGVAGVHFAVWAPNARRVSVVGDFNRWDGRRHVMRKRVDSGVWEIFLPGLGAGVVYKYEIAGPDGALVPLKADPFAAASELRPSTASVVAAPDRHVWKDGAWMSSRAARDLRREPMSIYEVHLGSWKRSADGGFLEWDSLADDLLPYAKEMGFTHVELMPVNEHPLDASWGYQPIGLFAPTRRFGDPEGFQRFVDTAHALGLGIIIDWVPAHFPTDAHGLARFDGTPLYEHADPRRGHHPDWGTAIYDYGRREVQNVLEASALSWLERFHVDALRVDAVASMLYLDYSRKAGEWLPNEGGGNENREAIAFLQSVNSLIYGEHPGTFTVAEESTSWPGVSLPVHTGGLGFGFKWNMGWMNDTLTYMARDPVHRRWHHREITFGLLYAFAENFVLPLSHDEVVHGKGTILSRMPGDDWQKFANVRAYYAFMWAYPGKKLLFMGQEFGQRDEWNADRSLDWHVLEHAPHRGLRALVQDLNHLYKRHPALYARDCEGDGFRWIVPDDADQSVFVWLRMGAPGDPAVAVAINFTSVPRHGYRIGLPAAGRWREILNTDATIYGGSGLGNLGGVIATETPCHGFPASAEITVPPLAAVYFVHTPGS
jgi:1,4-alpha-glucan branching enzyme